MKSPTYPLTLSLIIASVLYFSLSVHHLSNLLVMQYIQINQRSKQSTVPAQYTKYSAFPLVFLRYNCLTVNQLWAVQNFFDFFLSPRLIVITVIIEAFYLGKLLTEKKRICFITIFQYFSGNEFVLSSNVSRGWS